ncbi:hypothetical protein NVP1101O_089 [Vibrio phage 1.101.O._10N.261.45.C6]|nr:hypothetical protein NVP1101O_089 [Vibrio phage 1.101.O._10N.261.45.C6]
MKLYSVKWGVGDMKLPQSFVSVKTLPEIDERLQDFLDNQFNYCEEEKYQILLNFKRELYFLIKENGLLDRYLISGLQVNDYIKQLEKGY